MSTPESKIKAMLKKVLDSYKPHLAHESPVQNGMGTPTLDINGCYYGHAFKIEAKAPGKKPTDRQVQTMNIWNKAGCAIFVIDGTESVTELRIWLEAVKLQNEG